MKMEKIGVLLVLTGLFLGCGAAQKTFETNTVLDEMISQKRFEIQAKSAQPMVTRAMSDIALSGLIAPGNTINRIDLNGSGYFLRVKGDSVSANLAYYGERQMGGGYNNNPGIVFEGVPETLEIIKDELKQNYTIKFTLNEKSENFMVVATAARNLTGTISITSSHRSRIRYMGDVEALKED